jgi:hypothetical protein
MNGDIVFRGTYGRAINLGGEVVFLTDSRGI